MSNHEGVVSIKGTANQITQATQSTTDKLYGGTEFDKTPMLENNIYKMTSDLEYGVFEDYSSAVTKPFGATNSIGSNSATRAVINTMNTVGSNLGSAIGDKVQSKLTILGNIIN
jgi:hypothetical protein